MKFRVLTICLFALIPFAAIADNSSPNSVQPPQSPDSASVLLQQPGSTASGVSSTGDGSVLQSNQSSLQGSTSDGASLSAPSGQSLQAPTTSDNQKVLLGSEADGTPQNINDQTSNLGEDLISIAIGILILCLAIWYLRGRANRPHVNDTPYQSPLVPETTNKEIEPSPAQQKTRKKPNKAKKRKKTKKS